MNAPATVPGQVTFESVLSSIRTAVDSGRIGTPVSVRIHWQCSSSSLREAAVVAVRIADAALTLETPSWRTRPDGTITPQSRILNILGEDRRGRTLLATLCSGSANELTVTVFGNHGTLRLEHAGLDEGSLTSVNCEAPAWQQSLVEAIG